MLLKNVASQGVYLFAYDTTNNAAKTGDSANIVGSVSKDGAASASTATANPTEIGGGVYWQPLSQSETNANAIALYWASSTAGIRVFPLLVLTSGVNLPAVAHSGSGGLPTFGTSTGQITATSGAVTVGTSNDKTGYSLASAGLDSVTIETGLNARQSLSIIAAACAGTSTGVDVGSPVYKGAGVSTTRISGTASSGNRSAITLSPPA